MPGPYPLSAAREILAPAPKRPVTFDPSPPEVQHIPRAPSPPPPPPPRPPAPAEEPLASGRRSRSRSRSRRQKVPVYAATESSRGDDTRELVRLARAILYAVCIAGGALTLLVGMGVYHLCRVADRPAAAARGGRRR